MNPEVYLEQQTDTSGVLIDSYLVTRTIGIIDQKSQLDPSVIVGLGSYLARTDVQQLINSDWYVDINLPATFKKQ